MPIKRQRSTGESASSTTNTGSACITPGAFLSSASILGIHPVPTAHANANNDTNSGSNINSISSSSPSSSSSSSSMVSSLNRGRNGDVVFNNDALEALRQCHAEFVAFVSSELASGTYERKWNKKKSRCTPSQHTLVEGDSLSTVNENNGTKSKEALDAKEKMRIVTPKDVEVCLSNLGLHSILQQVKMCQQELSSSTECSKVSSSCNGEGTKGEHQSTPNLNENCNDITVTQTQSFADVGSEMSSDVLNDTTLVSNSNMVKKPLPKRPKVEGTRKRTKKLKKAFRNVKMTEDLLKEQERLFAESAARAKERAATIK